MTLCLSPPKCITHQASLPSFLNVVCCDDYCSACSRDQLHQVLPDPGVQQRQQPNNEILHTSKTISTLHKQKENL